MQVITDTEQLRAIAEEYGNHFFDASALRFFSSRIHRAVYGGRYFVTSEQRHGVLLSSGWVPGDERRYSIRRFALINDHVSFDAVDENGDDTSDAFQLFATRDAAHRAARALAHREVTLTNGTDGFAVALESYIESLLWSSIVYGEEYGQETAADEHAGPSADLLACSEHDLRNFLALVWDSGLHFGGLTPTQIGHNFALTRNHHGAGFWDCGLGTLGERLTDAAQSFGTADLYVRADDTIDVIA